MTRLFKRYGTKVSRSAMVRPGLYRGALWQNEISIERLESGVWQLNITRNERERQAGFEDVELWFRTLKETEQYLNQVYGKEQLKTRNMMNPEAGEVSIDRSDKGGCCDPGTETYWSM